MFNVTEEKTIEYWYDVDSVNGQFLEVSGTQDNMTAQFLERQLAVAGSKDVAAALRKFADALLKIASKLEAIK